MVEVGFEREGGAVTPSLLGRIQTRIFLIVVIGGLWTLIITPLLPGVSGAPYRATFSILAMVGVLGILWEFPYHGLQQFRWDKDWPTLFGLITIFTEGIVAWFVVRAGLVPGLPDGVPFSAFFVHYSTTMLVAFLFANGPMRVPFIRWRFRAGRLV